MAYVTLSSSTRVHQQPNRVVYRDQIDIDINNLPEWCGIKPDEIGISDYGRYKNLPVVEVSQLLKLPINWAESHFEGKPPFQYTFKSAVEVVVKVINQTAKIDPWADVIPLFCPGMYCDLINPLSKVDTKRPDLISPPPRYAVNSAYSPEDNNHQYWLGAILHMLYEQGHLSAYGKKEGEYWVSLNWRPSLKK